MKIQIAMVGCTPTEVEAVVTGEWAVHRDATFEDEWTVTHVPTGLRIPRYMTRQEAVELCRRLADEVPSLGLPAGLPEKQPKMNDLGTAYADTIKLAATIVAEVLGS